MTGEKGDRSDTTTHVLVLPGVAAILRGCECRSETEVRWVLRPRKVLHELRSLNWSGLSGGGGSGVVVVVFLQWPS